MDDGVLEPLLRRDRLIVAGALGIVTLLAWVYVVRLVRDMNMGGMDMSAARMISTGLHMVMAPAVAPWTAAEFALTFVMWTVMMIGLMTPSAAPLVLLYAAVGRKARIDGAPFAATAWFASGYLASWTLFALAATAVQWALQRAALLTAMMATAARPLSAVILIAAGVYQWTRLKDLCLTQCQSPLGFLQVHGGFRPDASGACLLGLRHGTYCVGCCWVLMALLFVGGVMNVVWIALLSSLVLAEKATRHGRAIARAAGVALVVGGVWFVL